MCVCVLVVVAAGGAVFCKRARTKKKPHNHYTKHHPLPSPIRIKSMPTGQVALSRATTQITHTYTHPHTTGYRRQPKYCRVNHTHTSSPFLQQISSYSVLRKKNTQTLGPPIHSICAFGCFVVVPRQPRKHTHAHHQKGGQND